MKKAIIALLCLALVAGGGYFGFRHYEKARDEKKVVKVVPLSMMAEPADMFMYNSSDSWGYISAANAQKVYVDTDKLVQSVNVKKGQKVKKGDTILEYDMTVVELQLAEKENQVKVDEQELKMAKKELNRLKGLHPSEDMPKNEPDIPDEPDPQPDPDYPEPEPVVTVPELTGATPPVSGSGAPNDPLVFNCGTDTVVRQPFLAALAGAKRSAVLCVYSESGDYLYQWYLTGEEIHLPEAAEWNVTDGLIFDKENNTISIDPKGVMHGKLSFAMPQNMKPMLNDNPEDEFPDLSDLQPDTPNTTGEQPQQTGDDYLYPRKELQKMIAAQEKQIKTLELTLKSSNLALETARKQKQNGKVVATVDGIVKKIGKPSGENTDETEPDEEEKDPFDEPSEDDNAFAVIEGEGGVEVIFEVPELSLKKLPVGTVLNVQSYQNGASSEAEITGLDDEPISYSANPWEANPNSSMYQMHAKLKNSDDFNIGSGVQVSMPSSQTDTGRKNSVFMPIHYVRQEDGDYYIMKADENNRLVKQYIRVGQILWGSYIEVKGGLDIKNDRICFPYGTDVKEGVRTEDSSEIQYPSNRY